MCGKKDVWTKWESELRLAECVTGARNEQDVVMWWRTMYPKIWETERSSYCYLDVTKFDLGLMFCSRFVHLCARWEVYTKVGSVRRCCNYWKVLWLTGSSCPPTTRGHRMSRSRVVQNFMSKLFEMLSFLISTCIMGTGLTQNFFKHLFTGIRTREVCSNSFVFHALAR